MSQLIQHYGPEFYERFALESCQSASVCVPMILDLLRPASVVDIGCGAGGWLREFAALGVTDYIGIDGEHVGESQLMIPAERFRRRDLSQPLDMERTFDVAISLEVAEHLPRRSAAGFVKSLTMLSPAVVFSAAIPGQGGINHVNEEWPWYWLELFSNEGYVRLDPFRPKLWKHSKVAFYYQQNLYLFVDPTIHKGLITDVGESQSPRELTLVRTSILQELTQPGPARRFLTRQWNKALRLGQSLLASK